MNINTPTKVFLVRSQLRFVTHVTMSERNQEKNRRAATSELTVQRLKQLLSSFLFRVWLCVC